MLFKSSVLLVVVILQTAVALGAPEKTAAAASSVQIPHPPPAPAVAHLKPQEQQPADEAFFEQCGPNGDQSWIAYRNKCYKFFEEPEYWYSAEQKCKSLGKDGHLVSVKDAGENSFVGKLTYCKSSWIGRYAVNADLMNQPSNYRWTDELVSQFSAHNFVNSPGLHHPLVSAANLQWFNNVYHGKQHYVCQLNIAQSNFTCGCGSGWKQLQNFCYQMPHFTATYVEADYYCRGRGAYVASIHSAEELRIMSLLDVETIGCPADTWTGLLKLNPCRKDYFTQTEICYRWSDRSGEFNSTHASFLKWAPGSPNPNPNPDQVNNCVLLGGREIRTMPCYTRARFVCKKPLIARP